MDRERGREMREEGEGGSRAQVDAEERKGSPSLQLPLTLVLVLQLCGLGPESITDMMLVSLQWRNHPHYTHPVE